MATDDFWKKEDIIFSYTDDEAVEDGVLVAVKYGEIGLVTTNALSDFLALPEDVRHLVINNFLKDASKTLEAKRKKKDDWFYEIEVWRRKYFVALNGKGSFTLMKPEDY